MSESLEQKKNMLKELIKEVHAGGDPEECKARFKEVLKNIGPTEISLVEQELIEEGMPVEEVQRLCGVHLDIFRESMGKEKNGPPPGHPVHILLAEHTLVKGFVEEISSLLPEVEVARDFEDIKSELPRITTLVGHLREYEKHKVREENCLFPYLEKHGVKQPPAIMWTEHDNQRKEIKEASNILADKDRMGFPQFKEKILKPLRTVTGLIPDHFFKEENILFPTGLNLISEGEWQEIKASMDELGYCYFTPEEAIGKKAAAAKRTGTQPGEIAFETGSLSKDELEAILNSLPVDITFVDREDRARYFSQAKDRIFPRAKAILGRTVQQCHPQKSLHVVNQILEDFKKGKMDSARFWIDVKGRKILIRYFAARDASGKYLGCVETSEDITDIRKLEGEKRLL